MHLLLPLFMLLLIGAILYHAWYGSPILPRRAGEWGVAGNDDPRVALAGMMYAVASVEGTLTGTREREIVNLLAGHLNLSADEAAACFNGGRRLARRVSGDLNSRLHQLSPPIAQHCSEAEKQQAIELLNAVAGAQALQIGSVRDGLGRLAATLLNA